MENLRKYAEKLIIREQLESQIAEIKHELDVMIRDVNSELDKVGGSIVINLKKQEKCVLLRHDKDKRNIWDAPTYEISITEEKAKQKLMLDKLE